MSKYKTYEELKEELGNKFDEYMYKSNIELLTKIEKAVEYINGTTFFGLRSGKRFLSKYLNDLLNILRSEDK